MEVNSILVNDDNDGHQADQFRFDYRCMEIGLATPSMLNEL